MIELVDLKKIQLDVRRKQSDFCSVLLDASCSCRGSGPEKREADIFTPHHLKSTLKPREVMRSSDRSLFNPVNLLTHIFRNGTKCCVC